MAPLIIILSLLISVDDFWFYVLFLFLSSGEKFKAVLLRMSKLASSGATELRVRSLEAISQLLTLQVCLCTHKGFLVSLKAIKSQVLAYLIYFFNF